MQRSHHRLRLCAELHRKEGLEPGECRTCRVFCLHVRLLACLPACLPARSPASLPTCSMPAGAVPSHIHPPPTHTLQICVADGRTDSEGTLYPNECTFRKCVYAAWLTYDTPRYNYLPLDCGSAVGCSLMGRAVDQCHKVWLGETETESSPKTDDACACALKDDPQPEPEPSSKRVHLDK